LHCGTNEASIPEIEGRFEPLAAVYASTIAPLVDEALRGIDYSVHQLVRAALRCDLGLYLSRSHGIPRALPQSQHAGRPRLINRNGGTNQPQRNLSNSSRIFICSRSPLARFLGEMSDTENRKKNSPAKATHEEQNLSPANSHQ
jgi:hypothetical protein